MASDLSELGIVIICDAADDPSRAHHSPLGVVGLGVADLAAIDGKEGDIESPFLKSLAFVSYLDDSLFDFLHVDLLFELV